MGLPYSRDLTFVDGTSQVPAETMNTLQDLAIINDKIRTGQGFLFQDEFLTGIDTAPWDLANTGTGATPTWLSDNADDGRGAVQFATSGSGAGTTTLDSIVMPIGTNDFSLYMRIRKEAGSGFTVSRYGLFSSTATKKTHFEIVNAAAEWLVVENSATAVPVGSPTELIATDQTYQKLQIIRTAGVISFLVDGVVTYTNANTVDLSDSYIHLAHGTYSGGAADVRIDKVALWIDL